MNDLSLLILSDLNTAGEPGRTPQRINTLMGRIPLGDTLQELIAAGLVESHVHTVSRRPAGARGTSYTYHLTARGQLVILGLLSALQNTTA